MQEFFKQLVVNPTDYTRAFEAGRLEVMRCDRPAADALCFLSTAPDAVDYVCFLCKNGRGEVPDTDHILGEHAEGDDVQDFDAQSLSMEI